MHMRIVPESHVLAQIKDKSTTFQSMTRLLCLKNEPAHEILDTYRIVNKTQMLRCSFAISETLEHPLSAHGNHGGR